MQPLILVLHVLTCVGIIALVLIQQGKGADIGAAFGSGASSTVFGSPGASSFLFKLTAGLAAIFFACSIGLSYIAATNAKHSQGLIVPAPQQQQQGQSQ
jgi:preprotein translocase subunit SecG